MKTILNIAYNT